MNMNLAPPLRDCLFISDRRDGARGASGRLYDWLRIAFGRERVFRDVTRIGVGPWRQKIDAALARSIACLAVIGPRWANAANLPRLKKSAEMVRHELTQALAAAQQKAMTLLPTRVEGASLPAALQPLYEWNARPISEDGWEEDIRRLISKIAAAGRLMRARQPAIVTTRRLTRTTPYLSANHPATLPAADRHRT